MRQIQRFWIVWSPSGQSEPKVQHLQKIEAMQAAIQMSARYPNSVFFVMQAVGMGFKPDKFPSYMEIK